MLLAQILKRWIRQGTFVVVDADGRTHRFVGSAQPSVTIRLHDRALHRKLFTDPRLHFGQAYMDGTLTVEEGTLADMLDILGRNHAVLDDQRLDVLARRVSYLSRNIQQYNSIGRAQKNAAHHYDLSDTLYDLFLDSDRQYSCAYFTTDIEILRLHYARTLHEWNRRFQKNRDRIEALYDERFCRMWEYYLQSCEMSFRHMDQMVFQMQLANRQDAVPDTREYVREWEHANAGEANIAV